MYFDTIHDVPRFDEVINQDGYTSYWETDTEVDSDFGNFIFNNVSGDSASMICIDDTIDLLALQKRNEQLISKSRSPHYKFEQSHSEATSPSSDDPLERSYESKQSYHSQRSFHSRLDGTSNVPPPVPPPRKQNLTAAEFQEHTYETLDDCKKEYQHQIYISKGSDGSRGSHDSTAKPVSNDEADSDRSSNSKGAEGAVSKSPGFRKPRSSSLQNSESVSYRQNRKVSEPSLQSRKRRLDKVSAKNNYPPPTKGFPTAVGVSENQVDHVTCCPSPERRNTCAPIVYPNHPRGYTASPERRYSSEIPNNKSNSFPRKAAPLIIKHKGKTYMVPVIDKKLQKELEKKSKLDNPTVIMHGVLRTNSTASNFQRSHASPPKVESSDHAYSHRRKSNNKPSSSPQKLSKQVTHYGVL